MRKATVVALMILCTLLIAACSNNTPASNTPSAATKAAFVRAMRSDYPASSNVSASDLSGIGGAICGDLMSGQSVTSVAISLGKQQQNGEALPDQFISDLIVEAPTYFCPHYVAAVQTWAGIN